MGAFTSALMAVGIGMKAVGTIKAGQDAQAAAEYNAAVYQEQAKAIEVKKGISNKRYDRLIDQLSGNLTTAVAASGYDYSGSFMAFANDQMTEAFLDKQIANYDLELQKSQVLSASDESIRSGKSARTASLWNAGGSLLTAGNDWYSKYGATDMGGGGVSQLGNIYGKGTPSGVTDQGTWSKF